MRSKTRPIAKRVAGKLTLNFNYPIIIILMPETEPFADPEEIAPAEADMTLYASQSLSSMWYVVAINFGAQAVDRLAAGRELQSPRAFAGFVGEVAISAVATSKGIVNLENYLASRRTKRAEATPDLVSAQ
jgi:hypothetical protein